MCFSIESPSSVPHGANDVAFQLTPPKVIKSLCELRDTPACLEGREKYTGERK
jgi:hypothetical protein